MNISVKIFIPAFIKSGKLQDISVLMALHTCFLRTIILFEEMELDEILFITLDFFAARLYYGYKRKWQIRL